MNKDSGRNRDAILVTSVLFLTVVTGYLSTGLEAGIASIFGMNQLESFREKWLANFELAQFIVSGLLIAAIAWLLICKLKKNTCVPSFWGKVGCFFAIFIVITFAQVSSYVIRYLWKVLVFSIGNDDVVTHTNMVSSAYLSKHIDVFEVLSQSFLFFLIYIAYARREEKRMAKERRRQKAEAARRLRAQRASDDCEKSVRKIMRNGVSHEPSQTAISLPATASTAEAKE